MNDEKENVYQEVLDHFLDEQRPDLIHVKDHLLVDGEMPLWTATALSIDTPLVPGAFMGGPLEKHFLVGKWEKVLDLTREECQKLYESLGQLLKEDDETHETTALSNE